MALSPLTRSQCASIVQVHTKVGYQTFLDREQAGGFYYSPEEVYLSLATPTSSMGLAYPTVQAWWEYLERGVPVSEDVGPFTGLMPTARTEVSGMVLWDFTFRTVPKGIRYFDFGQTIHTVLENLEGATVAKPKPDRMVIESKGDRYIVEGDFTVRKEPRWSRDRSSDI